MSKQTKDWLETTVVFYTSLTLINLGVIVIISTNKLFAYEEYSESLKHPVVLAFLGFTLSNFFGQKIIHEFQLRKFKFEELERKKTEQVKAASAFFEDFSHRMDKRLYYERKLLIVCNDRKKGRVGADVEADVIFSNYTEFLYEWNSTLNLTLSKIEQFFGEDTRKHYDERITKDFNWIRQLLIRKYRLDKDPAYSVVFEAIDLTNARVLKLDKKMLKMIKNEKVGSFLELG